MCISAGGILLYLLDVCTAIYAVWNTLITPGLSPLQVALAVSLNLRTYLHLKATTTGSVCVNLPNIDTFLSWDLSELKQFIPLVSGKGRHTLIYPSSPNRACL